MAATNQYMESAADTLYKLSSDRMVQEQCLRRAAYENFQRHQAAVMTDLIQKIAALKQANAERDAALADKDSMIAQLI